MSLRRLLIPLACIVEAVALPVAGPAGTGFGNWVMDRKIGDPKGKLLQTRDQALNDQYIKSKQPPR